MSDDAVADDVLEAGGPDGPRRGPRGRVRRIAAGAALAIGAGAVLVQQTNSDRRQVEDGRRPAAASTPVAQLPLPALAPSPKRLPWPTAPRRCGGDTEIALFEAGPLTERTGMTIVMGGTGLRRVSVDSGSVSTFAGTTGRNSVVEAVAVSGGTMAGLVQQCGGSATPRLVRVSEGSQIAPPPNPAEGLLQGPDAIWALEYPLGEARFVVLHGLDANAGQTVRLPRNTSPFSLATSALVATVESDTVDEPPTIVALNPTTGRKLRTLGRGWPVDASDTKVFYTPNPCDSPARCTLFRTDIRTGAAGRPITFLPGQGFAQFGSAESGWAIDGSSGSTPRGGPAIRARSSRRRAERGHSRSAVRRIAPRPRPGTAGQGMAQRGLLRRQPAPGDSGQ